MVNYNERQEALLNSVDADGFVLFNLEGSDWVSMFYLTGFTGGGTLILTKDKPLLLVSSIYIEQARREVPDLPLQRVKTSYENAAAKAIRDLGIRRLSLSSRRMSYYLVERLKELTQVEIVTQEDPVGKLRLVKDADEISCIREATRVTEESLSELLKKMKVGISEHELALHLEFLMRDRGAEAVAFNLIVAAGENTSLPHHQPSDRKLREGDLLLFDIGARVDKYCSDMTRVFSVGKPSQRARKIYDLVLRANQAGIAVLKAGVSGNKVDTIARQVITNAGYKEYFYHELGHGVGLEVHESPRLSPFSKDILEAGMVITVEPGVYLPGVGGVRIEDLFIITPTGYELLTSFPRKQLMEVG